MTVSAPSSATPPSSFSPVETINGDLAGGLLLLCEHASNRLPEEYGSLGLPTEQLERHIGYDIGARALTVALAEKLKAPARLTTYSRLLIDPNRGEDDPTLIMRLSDGAVVPGNARIGKDEWNARIERFHRPYHQLVDATLDEMSAKGPAPLIISIHSYTPVWRGVPRPWHAGLLWDTDFRATGPILDALRADSSLVIGDNEPYDGALKNDSMYRHGTARGIAHALIEVRQDLIGHESGVKEWAERLFPILDGLREMSELRQIRHFGSRRD